MIQGEEKVSVHPMITIQKVTSNVQNVPSLSPDIYWNDEFLFSKTVFSIARSAFRMYSVTGHLQIINCGGNVRMHWVFQQVHRNFWSPVTIYCWIWSIKCRGLAREFLKKILWNCTAFKSDNLQKSGTISCNGIHGRRNQSMTGKLHKHVAC
jgi:hypothetical protein